MIDGTDLNGCSSKPCSILMYSHDGFGLGHLKRNFNIAKHAIETIPNSQALLIMGHTSIPFHPIPHGIDFIKVPSIIKVQNESWQPRSLPMNPDKFKNFRASLIRNVALHYKPDIFIVDYVPKGVWGELGPTLQLLKEKSKETKIVLGLRDIIDDPAVTKNRWKKGRTYETIRRYYDKVLIYGAEEIYPTAHHYGLTGTLAEKVTYCGYLCSEEPYNTREWVREELRLRHDKLIVVTAGGGGDAYPMMRLCLEAFRELSQKIDCEALFITGPLMPLEYKRALEQQKENLPVKLCTSLDGILSYMNAADLLVTMGSYNTMMEAVRLNRPTLVIPREGPSAEQQIRTELFTNLGFVKGVPAVSAITPAELSAAMLETLVEQRSHPVLDMQGLTHAVQEISRLHSPPVPKDEKIVITA